MHVAYLSQQTKWAGQHCGIWNLFGVKDSAKEKDKDYATGQFLPLVVIRQIQQAI